MSGRRAFVDNNTMHIAEIFHSIQGEGLLVGMPSVFVRTSGCNLRCWFCDTPYTSWSPEGESLSLDEIMARVQAYPQVRHAVVTGGEPLIAPAIDELCQRLRAAGYHITIETAATLFRPIACDLASLSPKLANSTPWNMAAGKFAERHEETRLCLDAINAWIRAYEYQFKFVIDQPGDTEEVLRLLDRLPRVDRSRVLLMPQATDVEDLRCKSQWLAEECKRLGLRFGPRLHLELYGHTRGT